MRSIAIREELTDEWQKHGVQEQKEYSILTAEIAKATFGLAPSEHKNLKGLKTQNLRDHMTDLELISALRGVLPPRLGLVTQRHFGVMSDSMKICCLPFLELRLRNGAGIKVQIWGDGLVSVEARGGRLVGLKNRRATKNEGKQVRQI